MSNGSFALVGRNGLEIVTFVHDVAITIAHQLLSEVGKFRRNQARIASRNEIHRHALSLTDRCTTPRNTPIANHNTTFAIPDGEK